MLEKAGTSQERLVQIPVKPLKNCMSLSKLPYLFHTQFLYMYNGDNSYNTKWVMRTK